jgi:hypothetical protein
MNRQQRNWLNPAILKQQPQQYVSQDVLSTTNLKLAIERNWSNVSIPKQHSNMLPSSAAHRTAVGLLL